MTTIETGLPLPPRKKPAYPELYEMPVGGSFSKPGDERQALHYACQHAKKSKGRRFAIRTDQTTNTVRVWRIE